MRNHEKARKSRKKPKKWSKIGSGGVKIDFTKYTVIRAGYYFLYSTAGGQITPGSAQNPVLDPF